MAKQNSFYLSFGRHERPGRNTAIEKEDMLTAFAMGNQLREWLPPCETVYYSPLPRTEETALFQALGLNCRNIVSNENLHESAPKFNIKRFVDQVVLNAQENVFYYHFVTHLPVIEKLGLPELGTGDVCLLSAISKDDMLAENFRVQIIRKNAMDFTFRQRMGLSSQDLTRLSPSEIYQRLKTI